MRRAYVEHVCEIVARESGEAQEKSGVQPGAEAVEARCELAIGEPTDEILRYADENGIDLILMATHGRSGIRRWALGSVADRVLRASKVPILLIRAGIPEEIVYDRWPKRTMLVPLDGSELAESVLPHVEALAKQRGAKLMNVVLLRVCEPPLIPVDPFEGMTLSAEAVQEVTTESKREAEEYLAVVEKRLKGAGLKVRSEVLVDNPAMQIIDYAHKTPPNLIVMASHGRYGLSRWALGSVADKVLHAVSSLGLSREANRCAKTGAEVS